VLMVVIFVFYFTLKKNSAYGGYFWVD